MSKYIVIVLLVILSVSNIYSQKLKFRIDIGNSIGFASHKSDLFHWFYQEPLITSEYTYTKLPNYSVFNVPKHIGFSLEFDYKEKNHLTLGVLFGEVLLLNDRLAYNFAPEDIDTSGYMTVYARTYDTQTETPLYKLSLAYSRDFGKGKLRFSPFVGASYAWIVDNRISEDVTYTEHKFGKDYMFPKSDFYVVGYRAIDRSTAFMGSLGINLKFHSKHRELFALKLYYEQSFKSMEHKYTVVYRNGREFGWNLLYSYGSAFYVKLSIPIPVYNFVDHKWGN